MKSRGYMFSLAAALSLGAASASPAEPGPHTLCARRRPAAPHGPKTPATDADFARIALAEQKRARKAAKLGLSLSAQDTAERPDPPRETSKSNGKPEGGK